MAKLSGGLKIWFKIISIVRDKCLFIIYFIIYYYAPWWRRVNRPRWMALLTQPMQNSIKIIAAPLPVCRQWQQSRHFVIIHASRSGSTVLGELLGQNPEISWHGEALEPYRARFEDYRLSNDKFEWYLEKLFPSHFAKEPFDYYTNSDVRFQMNPKKLLPHYFAKTMTAKKFVGCSLQAYDFLYSQGGLKYFLELYSEFKPSAYFIQLSRRNLMRLVLSKRMAAGKNIWHSTTPAAGSPPSYTVGDIREFIREIKVFERWQKEQEQALAKYHPLKLVYEDDIMNTPVVAYEKICRFFNLKPSLVSPKLVRTNPWKSSEILMDYDVLERGLRNTPYEWMLEE